MSFFKGIFFLVLVSLFSFEIIASQDTTKITISGHAYDSINPSQRLDDLMIINLKTSQGKFGKVDGTFMIEIDRTDTILIASYGYEYKRIYFADSIVKSAYNVEAPLVKLSVNLKDVNVFSPRDLQSIYNDIQRLGYNKKDFELSGVDAVSAPITFLYQQFNQLERLKQHNRERINEDKKRNLLRSLMANYVAHDIINLDEFEFDDFINFCNVSESYMKSATQYDFCMYIKQRFEVYAMLKKK